jgi:hypothetical protein
MDTNGRELAFIRMDSRFKNCSHLAQDFNRTKRNPKQIKFPKRLSASRFTLLLRLKEGQVFDFRLDSLQLTSVPEAIDKLARRPGLPLPMAEIILVSMNAEYSKRKLKLERVSEGVLGNGGTGEAVWKMKLWAAKVRQPQKDVDIREVWLSASDGKVEKNDPHISRVD